MPEPALPPALLVTRNFPPLVGGMERVNQELLQALARRRPVGLCGPTGCAPHAPGAVQVWETPLRPLWRFVLGAAWRSWRAARRLRPTLVLAGSGLAAPMAWLAARASGARLGVYLHGLDVIVDNAIYQRLWLPFIRAADLVLVNSRHTAGLAAGKGLDPGRISVLNPGTEVPALDPGAGASFRARLGLGERPVLLSVGRLTRRKGLVEFVRGSLPAIAAVRPDVLLLVVGEEAADALHTAAGSERERIEAAARAAGVSGNLRFAGRCSGEELAQAYQAAQVHVFPVLDLPGDVEGFGMVALESAAHGLRTAAFAVGGVPDAVDPGCSGVLVPAGDYPGLATAVLALLESPPGEATVRASRDFAQGKDWEHFAQRLQQLTEGGDGRD